MGASEPQLLTSLCVLRVGSRALLKLAKVMSHILRNVSFYSRNLQFPGKNFVVAEERHHPQAHPYPLS